MFTTQIFHRSDHTHLTLEWFLGAGIRFRNNVRQDVGYDALQLSRNGERSFKDKKFRLEAGIRVGFQL